MSITLEEIDRIGNLKQGFRSWFSILPASTQAPMKATVGINGEMVFKPRSYLDPLSEAEFYAALDRIDELFEAKPGTPEGYELEALSIAAEAHEKKEEQELHDLARQLDR